MASESRRKMVGFNVEFFRAMSEEIPMKIPRFSAAQIIAIRNQAQSTPTFLRCAVSTPVVQQPFISGAANTTESLPR